MAGLADGQLDGIGSGVDHGADGLRHGFDSAEERGFVEETVIDGDIEAFAIGSEKAIEAGAFHHHGKGV